MNTEIMDLIGEIMALYLLYMLIGLVVYSILSQKWIFSNSRDKQSSRCMRYIDKVMSKMYGNISLKYDLIFIYITYPVTLCKLLYLHIKDEIS